MVGNFENVKECKFSCESTDECTGFNYKFLGDKSCTLWFEDEQKVIIDKEKKTLCYHKKTP